MTLSIRTLYHYDKGNYDECQILFIIILNVIMLSVIMLSVIMLSVIMLSVIMLSVIMLSVIMLRGIAPVSNTILSWEFNHCVTASVHTWTCTIKLFTAVIYEFL
jgi:hypothetical protein